MPNTFKNNSFYTFITVYNMSFLIVIDIFLTLITMDIGPVFQKSLLSLQSQIVKAKLLFTFQSFLKHILYVLLKLILS